MKKKEKEEFFKKIIKELLNSKEIFSEKEKKIIEYFPFFTKEGIEFLDQVFSIESCFKDLENFDLEYQGKQIRCFFVEVNDRTSSSSCIKASKACYSGTTLFLGTKGIDILRKKFPEKIIGKNIYTFNCKHSNNPNDIPGIFLEKNGYYTMKFLSHPCSIGAHSLIAIFKEIN